MTPEAARRRAVRAWARTHHPDLGGDPAVFAEGLTALRAGRLPGTAPRPARAGAVRVVRSRGPRAWLRRLLAPRRAPSRTLR